MSNEGEFYDHLFQSFYSLRHESNEIELWKNQRITELMKNLHNKDDSRFIQNALIVIMALFDEYLMDSFHFQSKNMKELNDGKKKTVISILKDEIFS